MLYGKTAGVSIISVFLLVITSNYVKVEVLVGWGRVVTKKRFFLVISILLYEHVKRLSVSCIQGFSFMFRNGKIEKPDREKNWCCLSVLTEVAAQCKLYNNVFVCPFLSRSGKVSSR